MIAVLAPDIGHGMRIMAHLGLTPAMVVVPSNVALVRGRTFTAVVEAPGFMDLPDPVREGMRDAALPCIAASGGAHFVLEEVR